MWCQIVVVFLLGWEKCVVLYAASLDFLMTRVNPKLVVLVLAAAELLVLRFLLLRGAVDLIHLLINVTAASVFRSIARTGSI